MAGERESWAARFLDYLALGLTLTGIDVIVRDGHIWTGLGLIIAGGVTLFVARAEPEQPRERADSRG
jgi:hypothetical protein